MILDSKKLGFSHSGRGIGDKVVYSSLPENYFRNTGRKLIDVERHWAYDHNPFVLRDVSPENVVDLWTLPLGDSGYPSLAQRICEGFGLETAYLRHARLYKFEDSIIDHKAVVVHVTGISAAAASMPDHVIEQISKTYRDFVIYQIGGINDKDTPFIDKRGLSIWNSIQVIASSGIFIGVDSGPINLANCYPRIRKKVIILRDLNAHVPVSHPIRWIDFNWEYYNVSSNDQGISMSYLKI